MSQCLHLTLEQFVTHQTPEREGRPIGVLEGLQERTVNYNMDSLKETKS